MYPDDMRMSQFEAALCFALELIKCGTIVNHQVGKKFERNLAIQFLVARQPNYSHSSSPEDLDQRVASKNFLSGGKLTRRRAYHIACAFVTHFEQVYIIKLGRKLKARRVSSYELEQGSKIEILRKLKQRFGGKTIRDVRFRVG